MISVQVQINNSISNVGVRLDKFMVEIAKTGILMREEIAREIRDTPGLGIYPPETAANWDPLPKYVRGQGTQTASGNLFNSEQYGKHFVIESMSWQTVMRNLVSYAIYLAHPVRQAEHMADIGWITIEEARDIKHEKNEEHAVRFTNMTLRKVGL